MTQIVVTLANGADENLLCRMIENMKGVVKTSLTKSDDAKTEGSEWLETVHSIRDSIGPSIIDTDDPRTNYIMSK